MLGVGDILPEFEITGVKPKFMVHEENGQSAFEKITQDSFKGKWKVYYFYPKDFTFICPTEIVAFNDAVGEFANRNCALLTASTDSVYSHKGWCDHHEELKGLKYPMLSDMTRKMSAAYDVLDEDKGLAYRGIFLIDPAGVLRWLAIHDLGVGRNVAEVLRVLDALQTDKLCPCNWKAGDKTLN